MSRLLPISVLIMSFNEEANIGTTLKSVTGRFNQIIVVDSFSNDNTIEICQSYPTVEIFQNQFTHWAQQRNWMLDNCNLKNDWVFFLDADESIDTEFFNELSEKFNNVQQNIFSFFINKDLYFLGKNIKHAYAHPPIRLIFRSKGLRYHEEGAREYATSEGASLEIKRPLIHEDKRPFEYWVQKHIRNAEREKVLYFERKSNPKNLIEYGQLPFALKVRKFIRNTIWSKLPLGLKPVFYFIFRYFIKMGFLDGKPGFLYCVNHALWYEMLIDIKILEQQNREGK